MQAVVVALEELKCNNQILQSEDVELRRLLREEKEEKKILQLQLRAAEEALEEFKLKKGLKNPSSPILESTSEVNDVDVSSISSSHAIISMGNVEIPIIGTGMRVVTKMGYKGGGLGINV